jgi:hypothetical protein
VKYSLIILVFVSASGCEKPSKFIPNHGHKITAEANWIGLPADYKIREYKYRLDTGRREGRENYIPIMDGRYTVHAAPVKYLEPDDGEFDYFVIAIHEPVNCKEPVSCNIAGLVISSLPIPLSYLSKDKVLSPAEDLVSFDSTTKTITFDLGNSVFKCQLSEKLAAGD